MRRGASRGVISNKKSEIICVNVDALGKIRCAGLHEKAFKK